MCRKKVRKLYLVRHGAVEFPENIRRCIGNTELPLSERGKKQAEKLAVYFQNHPVTKIITSPRGRCRETAQILSGGRYPIESNEGFRELNMGEWENVPLRELKKNYGKTLCSEPVQGEKRTEGLERFRQSVDDLLEHSKGDIVCVSHAGIICCYLADLMKKPLETSRALPQPYGGISLIEVSSSGEKEVVEYGRMPETSPTAGECESIWEHYHTPDPVKLHCKTVAKLALELGRALNNTGCELNLKWIESAALLHDVAKTESKHAEKGAEIIRREGYPEIAEIIRYHHDLKKEKTEPGNLFPNELEVVYLADKHITGNKIVSLEERFAQSRKQCEMQTDSAFALMAHTRRYEEAKSVEYKIKRYLGFYGTAIIMKVGGQIDAGII